MARIIGYILFDDKGGQDFVFAVLTLVVRSLMSSVQSAQRESKAEDDSTSSLSRRSILEMSAGEFMSGSCL